jgi:hypothetical protein
MHDHHEKLDLCLIQYSICSIRYISEQYLLSYNKLSAFLKTFGHIVWEICRVVVWLQLSFSSTVCNFIPLRVLLRIFILVGLVEIQDWHDWILFLSQLNCWIQILILMLLAFLTLLIWLVNILYDICRWINNFLRFNIAIVFIKIN